MFDSLRCSQLLTEGYMITCALAAKSLGRPQANPSSQNSAWAAGGHPLLGLSPEGILLDGDPEVLANVVDGTHTACASTPLQKGSHHV